MKCTFMCLYIYHCILCVNESVINVSLSTALFWKIATCITYIIKYFDTSIIKMSFFFLFAGSVYLREKHFFLLYFSLFNSILCLGIQKDSLLIARNYPLLNNRRQK